MKIDQQTTLHEAKGENGTASYEKAHVRTFWTTKAV